MTWVFVVLIGVIVVVVALVVVGRITGQLAAEPQSAYVDLDDTVLWVADHLSDETTAEISYDDVRAVVGWYFDYLTDKDIARTDDLPAASGPLVANEDEAVAYVLAQLASAGATAPELTDAQVVEICDTQRTYLVAVGAVRSIDS